MTTAAAISVSLADAARSLGISTRHAKRMVSRGEFPGAYHIGRRVLVHVATLDAAIAEMATESTTSVEPSPPSGVSAPLVDEAGGDGLTAVTPGATSTGMPFVDLMVGPMYPVRDGSR